MQQDSAIIVVCVSVHAPEIAFSEIVFSNSRLTPI